MQFGPSIRPRADLSLFKVGKISTHSYPISCSQHSLHSSRYHTCKIQLSDLLCKIKNESEEQEITYCKKRLVGRTCLCFIDHSRCLMNLGKHIKEEADHRESHVAGALDPLRDRLEITHNAQISFRSFVISAGQGTW
jgi:hypothetical protein